MTLLNIDYDIKYWWNSFVSFKKNNDRQFSFWKIVTHDKISSKKDEIDDGQILLIMKLKMNIL